METNISKTPQAVAEAFASHFIALAKANETLSVALSGGSTPKTLFDLLAEHHGKSIDWSRVHFYWGDERCVPPTDGDSNYKMTVDHLFSKIDFPEQNVHRVLGESEPDQEALRYAEQITDNLPSADGLPQFDLIILGMGGDGHTASIFPHEIKLLDSTGVCAVATHPESGQKRITLTGKVINNAKEICFLVTGAGKTEKIDEIFHQAGEWKSYPASYINPKEGKLTWFMDEAAAQKL
ncbi:MAG: 6-phosphogluconolactonase [Roseivirga sp.]|nr:6-phosphogluconolactonase [Roseivirga sp.]